jgi:hypothetical protein
MRRALRAPIRTAVATACVLRAAARVAWYEPRTALPELVATLRDAPRSRFDIDAHLVEGALERLLPVLPPFGAGRCVKRALTQLDLCARAGLEPHFHVGFLGNGAGRQGHVWVTTGGAANSVDGIEGPTEAWSA